jgi:long-chain fatty acid transport protein
VIELAPAVSYQINDRLAIGVGPMVDMANLKVDPAFIAAPDPVGGLAERFPNGGHTRFEWGIGAQAGITYVFESGWHLGASVKSPRWFERFGFNSTDAIGRPRHFTFDADLPLVISTGVAYTGFERWVLEADVHYIDYANAEGLRETGFAPTGAVQGIGWKSIWALALGAQYKLTDHLSVQAGYTFNDSPIDSAHSFFNVASPTIIEHTVSIGASYWLTDCFSMSLMYGHGFENSVTGPIVTPFGAIPGSSVTSVVSADTVVFGATVLFGGRTN